MQTFQALAIHRPLEKVDTVGIVLQIFDQPPQGARFDQHVAVQAEHEIRVGLTEYQVPHRRAAAAAKGDIAVIDDDGIQVFQGRGSRAFRVVVDYQDFGLLGNFRMVEPDRLGSEIDPVVVIIGGHADGQQLFFSRRGGGRDGFGGPG